MAQKKVSKTFKSGPFTYKVHFQKESDECCGKTCTTEKEIWINTRYSDEVQRETLFHEILHVAFEDCALLDKPYEKMFDMEEDLIRFISPRLVQIFQDSDWLGEYIFGNM